MMGSGDMTKLHWNEKPGGEIRVIGRNEVSESESVESIVDRAVASFKGQTDPKLSHAYQVARQRGMSEPDAIVFAEGFAIGEKESADERERESEAARDKALAARGDDSIVTLAAQVADLRRSHPGMTISDALQMMRGRTPWLGEAHAPAKIEPLREVLMALPDADKLEASIVTKRPYRRPESLMPWASKDAAQKRFELGQRAGAGDREARRELDENPIFGQYRILQRQAEANFNYWAPWYQKSGEIAEWMRAQEADASAPMPGWFHQVLEDAIAAQDAYLKSLDARAGMPAPERPGLFSNVTDPLIHRQAEAEQAAHDRIRQDRLLQKQRAAEAQARDKDLVPAAKR
jgi:hypothetical protein